MGSEVRIERGDRFIQEFEKDVIDLFRKDLDASGVDIQEYRPYLSGDDNGRICLFGTIGRTSIIFDGFQWDPEFSDDIVEFLCDAFDMSEKEAQERAEKADLL